MQTRKTKPRSKQQAKLAFKSTKKVASKPLPSETKQYQLAQVYLNVEANGQARLVRAALDSQSNVTYVSERLGK